MQAYRYSELLCSWTLFIARYSRNYKTQRFENFICFRPQVRDKTLNQLDPLERANLNHWI
jgi:hypothetical protein